MSRVSTFAGSSFSPERMLRSTTAPVSKFLNLVRVKAAPLPGLTNWNSTMVYGFPSINTFRPLRISDVSYMTRHVYPARDIAVKPPFCWVPTRLRITPSMVDKARDGGFGALPPPVDARPRRVPGGGCSRGARPIRLVAVGSWVRRYDHADARPGPAP